MDTMETVTLDQTNKLMNLEALKTVCHACLSCDRVVTPVEDIDLFVSLCRPQENITEFEDVNVCWECAAILKKIRAFQEQIQFAQVMLRESLYEKDFNVTCLTKLECTTIDNINTIIIKHKEDSSSDNSDIELIELIETKIDDKKITNQQTKVQIKGKNTKLKRKKSKDNGFNKKNNEFNKEDIGFNKKVNKEADDDDDEEAIGFNEDNECNKDTESNKEHIGFKKENKGLKIKAKGFSKKDSGFNKEDIGFNKEDNEFNKATESNKEHIGFKIENKRFNKKAKRLNKKVSGFNKDDKGFNKKDSGFNKKVNKEADDDEAIGFIEDYECNKDTDSNTEHIGFKIENKGFKKKAKKFNQKDRGFNKEDIGFNKEDNEFNKDTESNKEHIGFKKGNKGLKKKAKGFSKKGSGFNKEDIGFNKEDNEFNKDTESNKEHIGFKIENKRFNKKAKLFNKKVSGFNKDDKGFNKKDSEFNKDDKGFNKKENGFTKDEQEFNKNDKGFNKDDKGFNKKENEFNKDDKGFNKKDKAFNKDEEGFNKKENEFNKDDKGFNKKENEFNKDDKEFNIKGIDLKTQPYVVLQQIPIKYETEETLGSDGAVDDNYESEREQNIKVRKEKIKRENKWCEAMANITINTDLDFDDYQNLFTKRIMTEEEILSLGSNVKKGAKHSKRLKCSDCEKLFSTTLNYRRHNTFCHILKECEPPYKCLECNESCYDEDSLKKHWEKHNLELHCTMCGFLIKYQYSMRTHALKHTRLYACKLCGAGGFNSQREFSAHLNALHRRVECEYCGKCYSTKHFYSNGKSVEQRLKNKLAEHIRKTHVIQQCKTCNTVYKSYTYLLNHLRMAHPEALKNSVPKEMCYCVECNRQYGSYGKYLRHLNTSLMHNQKKLFPCREPTCGKQFSRKLYMNNHYKLVHNKQTKHRCVYCGKYMISAWSVRKHMMGVHMKIRAPKDKVCYVCGRAFNTNAILTRHMRTHTGERPYKCDHCPAAFTQRTPLVTHTRTQHKIILPSSSHLPRIIDSEPKTDTTFYTST